MACRIRARLFYGYHVFKTCCHAQLRNPNMKSEERLVVFEGWKYLLGARASRPQMSSQHTSHLTRALVTRAHPVKRTRTMVAI